MSTQKISPGRGSWMVALVLAGLVPAGLGLTGCGEDAGIPTGPGTNQENGGEGEGGGPETEPDIPRIPKPTALNADTPMESETLTVIRPLATTFRPQVVSAYATFTIKSRACLDSFITCCTAWVTPYADVDMWSGSIPATNYDHGRCSSIGTVPITLYWAMPSWGEPVLVDGAQILAAESGSFSDPIIDTQSRIDKSYTYRTKPLTEVPHVRRDRRWVRQQLSDGSFVVDLAPNTEATFITTQRSGVSYTESQSFAETVSVTGGLSAYGVAASIERTVTETFTVSTTVWADTTNTVERKVIGEAGKQTVFMLWGLEEVYSFTHADGEPFTDPNYEFNLQPAVFRGSRFALDATTFDIR